MGDEMDEIAQTEEDRILARWYAQEDARRTAEMMAKWERTRKRFAVKRLARMIRNMHQEQGR